MELKSMSDFVLSRSINAPFVQRFTECENYANFLKQPLILSMFVPCGNNGEVLEEPSNYKEWNKKECSWWDNYTKCLEYQQAKESCLFEGFKWNVAEFCDDPMIELEKENGFYMCYDCEDKIFSINDEVRLSTIEDLILINLDKPPFTLTQSAINQITTTR